MTDRPPRENGFRADVQPAPVGYECDGCDGTASPGVSFNVKHEDEVILCRACLLELVKFDEERRESVGTKPKEQP